GGQDHRPRCARLDEVLDPVLGRTAIAVFEDDGWAARPVTLQVEAAPADVDAASKITARGGGGDLHALCACLWCARPKDEKGQDRDGNASGQHACQMRNLAGGVHMTS